MKKEDFTTVTPLSKIVALILFACLPFAGFYLGVKYQKNVAPTVEQENSDSAQTDEDSQEEQGEEVGEEDTNESNSPDEEDAEDMSTVQTSTFSGTAVEAEVPSGWSIVEYFDGAGTDMLVGGVTYEGLTGLEIKHGSTVIFSLKGVSGIGGLSTCDEVVEFSDTPATYISDVVADSLALGVTTTVIDHTATAYSEFIIFSNRMRRISHDLYWDMDMTNHSFETNCGLDGTAFPAYGLEFVSEPGTSMESTITTYWYEINSAATAGELDTLEDIFATLVAL